MDDGIYVGKDVIRNEQIRGSEDRKNMNDDTRKTDGLIK